MALMEITTIFLQTIPHCLTFVPLNHENFQKLIQIYFSAIPTEPAGEVKPRKFSIWKLFNSSILSVLSANAKTRQFDKLKDHFVKQIGKILLHFSSRIGREQTTKSQSAYSGASFCRKSSFHKLSTRSARRLDRSFSFC